MPHTLVHAGRWNGSDATLSEWVWEPFSLASSIEGRRHRMDMLMALAISIGVLIAVWVKVGTMASLAVPAGIVAWALFYAAGGKTQGLQKVIASTLSGVVWVWLATTLIGAMNMGSMTCIVIGVVGFVLVIHSKALPLSVILGAFCRAAQ